MMMRFWKRIEDLDNERVEARNVPGGVLLRASEWDDEGTPAIALILIPGATLAPTSKKLKAQKDGALLYEIVAAGDAVEDDTK